MAASAKSGVAIGSSEAATNVPASKAAIAMLILLSAAYAYTYTPLAPIYPSEVLGSDQRSTGMGVMVLVGNACIFLNQFAIPIALEKIGWCECSSLEGEGRADVQGRICRSYAGQYWKLGRGTSSLWRPRA